MFASFRVSRKLWDTAVLLAALLCTPVAFGQMQVGDNLFMSLDGNLGYGYSASFANFQPSSHAQGVSGNANLHGYYFHPNFLSYDVHPYYDRAASSSESQSITRSDGLNSSVTLFSGSNFPMSASYGLDFSNNSQFYVAGVPSVVGNSRGQHYNFSISEILPSRPHLYFNFSDSSSRARLLSATDESKSSSKNMNLFSDYMIAGFDLRGTLTHNINDFKSPEFATGQSVAFGGSGTTYGLTAQHKIPLGTVGLGWSHSSYDSDQGGGGSGNNYSEGVGITLFRKLSLNENLNYTTNTTASLSQSILNGGPPIRLPDRNSEGLFFMSTATWPIFRGLAVTGHFSHRDVTFQQQEFSDNQYGGSVNFTHQNRFLGFMNFSVGFVDTANKTGNTGAGLVTTLGMNKKIKHWETSGDFNYYQSVQTLYTNQTTSSYGFGGTIRRKINDQLHWGASFRGTHSGLTVQDGNYNKSQSFNTNLSWRRYAVSGTYSKSDGLAVLNSTGDIVPTPLGPLLSDYVYVFNAENWSVNGSARLIQRLTVSGGYTNVSSDSRTGVLSTPSALATISNGARYFGNAEYRLRRFSILGGYSRIEQNVSTIPGGPRNLNTYYISLSRWFSVF